MKIPSGIYIGRDAIEGLVPRDSAISAIVHVAMGVGIATAGTMVVPHFLPKQDPAKPHEFTKKDWYDKMKIALPLAVFPLVLTAGMQLHAPTERALAHGVHPMYFLAAGAMFGAAFLSIPLADAMSH